VSLKKEELEQIPVRYRWLVKLLMKLPNPSFPNVIVSRLPEIEGIFWAVVIPLLLLIYFFFSVWFVVFLSIHVIFPFNILLGLLMPSIFFVFFLRIQLERTILAWKNTVSPHKVWDVSDVVEELRTRLRYPPPLAQEKEEPTEREHA